MRSRPAGQMGPGTAGESFAGQQVRGSRILGQAVPGVWASAGVRAQVRAGLTGGVPLQAADDLGLGFSFLGAASGVGAGGGVGAQAGEHDPPQGVAGLPVAAGVEPACLWGVACPGATLGRCSSSATSRRKRGAC